MISSRRSPSKKGVPALFAYLFRRTPLCVLALGMEILTVDSALFGHDPQQPKGVPEVQPEKGIFLVAHPRIGGPFRQTVVLLLAHGEQGTLGLVVNRPTDVPLSEVLPEMARGDKESRDLYFGGPVGLENLIFMFRSDKEEAGAAHVMDDVYFSGDRQVLERVIGERGPDRLRIYIGHSGWAPRQLDAEIARGDWRLVRADATAVFGRNSERLWKRLSPPAPSSIVASAFSGQKFQ